MLNRLKPFPLLQFVSLQRWPYSRCILILFWLGFVDFNAKAQIYTSQLFDRIMLFVPLSSHLEIHCK